MAWREQRYTIVTVVYDRGVGILCTYIIILIYIIIGMHTIRKCEPHKIRIVP